MREQPECTGLDPGAQGEQPRPGTSATQEIPKSLNLPGEARCHYQKLVWLFRKHTWSLQGPQGVAGSLGQALVHTQHQEKQNEALHCSTEGHGHMGGPETKEVSAWARQGSEVGERWAEVEMPAADQHRNRNQVSLAWLVSRKGGGANWGRLFTGDKETPRGGQWSMREPAELRTGEGDSGHGHNGDA